MLLLKVAQSCVSPELKRKKRQRKIVHSEILSSKLFKYRSQQQRFEEAKESRRKLFVDLTKEIIVVIIVLFLLLLQSVSYIRFPRNSEDPIYT